VREFSTARDSASITSTVTKYGLSILSSTEETGKVGWVGDDSHVAFDKKILW
jgi:hypothetical protein